MNVYSTSGALQSSFATAGATIIAMDNAGNVYANVIPNLNSFAHGTVVRYAIGANTPNANYTPALAGDSFFGLWGSPPGTIMSPEANWSSTVTSVTWDIWNPGASGAPSHSFTHSSTITDPLQGTLGPDGTAVIPYYDNGNNVIKYDIILPGSGTLSRTVSESLVPGSGFSPNVMALASDGTLYVGEFNKSNANDPNAGLYIYPATLPGSGTETRVGTGSLFPTGIDFDVAGNVYVLSSNWQGPSFGPPTVNRLDVYTHTGSPIRSISGGGISNGQGLTVAADGTAYIVEFPDVTGTTGLLGVISPTATSITQIVSGIDIENVVLYNGSVATLGRHVHGSGGSAR